MENINLSPDLFENLSLDRYEAIYEAALSLANDADGYGLFEDITDEDVEKCKWIAAILEVLDDVPRSRVKHIFNYRNIQFDHQDFIEGE